MIHSILVKVNNKKKKNTRHLLSLHNIHRNRAGIYAESPIMEQTLPSPLCSSESNAGHPYPGPNGEIRK